MQKDAVWLNLKFLAPFAYLSEKMVPADDVVYVQFNISKSGSS